MLLAWRFSRTFASRFNFANVVFFLPPKVGLQSCRRTQCNWHGGDPAEHVFRPADARPRPGRVAAAAANAPSAAATRRLIGRIGAGGQGVDDQGQPPPRGQNGGVGKGPPPPLIAVASSSRPPRRSAS